MKSFKEFLNERTISSKKVEYQEGTFGYWWTVIEGEEDISGQHYDGLIECRNKGLTSLEGAPKSVGGYFDCYNNKLRTLEGAPKSVEGDFDCSKNKLRTLEGAPKSVGGNFYCSENHKKFTEEEVRAVCEVKKAVVV